MKVSEKIINIYEEKIGPAYKSKPRISQVQMSLDIADFLYNKKAKSKIMFVEAPVGTGKTLGALIPAILYSSNFHKRITYVTGTKNLQRQVFYEELKMLKNINIISPSSETVLAMGKDNYACIDNLHNNRNNFQTAQRFNILKKILGESDTGFRIEINNRLDKDNQDLLSDVEWELIRIKNRQKTCEIYNCPGHRYRDTFNNEPYITVTNQNQMIQSLINMTEEKKGIVSVTSGIVIIDEAQLFDNSFLGVVENSLNIAELKRLSVKHEYTRKFNESLKSIEEEFSKLRKKRYGLNTRYPLTSTIFQALHQIQQCFQASENIEFLRVMHKNPYAKYEDLIFNILNTEQSISWMTVTKGNKITFIPKNFYEKLKEWIKKLSVYNKIIFLSGTLTNTDDPFKEIENEWGIKDFIYKKYKSPFSPKHQVYLTLPEKGFNNLKNKRKHATEMVNKIIKPLCNSISGGILILSNSLELKDNLSKEMKSKFKNRLVLTQGQRSNSYLTKLFKRETDSILIGSGSFKTGFSIPGEALQAVVLSSLPFPVPDDPYIKLKVETFAKRYDKSESEIYLQLMLKDLEQSMGRLIRSIDDYGVIVVTDSRLYSKSYGKGVRDWLTRKNYKIWNDFSSLSHFTKTAPQKIQKNKLKSYNEYSRSKLNISQALLEINVSNNKNIKKEIIKHVVSATKDYEILKNKVLKWQKEYNKVHPDNKISLTGINKVKNINDVIKVVGDGAYKAYADPELILKTALGDSYKANSYTPSYTLMSKRAGKVKTTYIK